MSGIKTYDGKHVMSIMRKLNINRNCIHLMDGEYIYLDSSKVHQFFWELSMQVKDALMSWQAQFRDCDKYSRVVQALGQMAHALQWESNKSRPAGLALGVFNYVDEEQGAHSINCAIIKVANKEEFDLKFFEPQTASEVTLTDAEIKSAFLILL
jgi:hypothetical protein